MCYSYVFETSLFPCNNLLIGTQSALLRNITQPHTYPQYCSLYKTWDSYIAYNMYINCPIV